MSRTFGKGNIGPNVGTSGGANGGGFGTKGFGVTFGFGPYNLRDIGESFRPQTDEFGNPFPVPDAPQSTPPFQATSANPAPAAPPLQPDAINEAADNRPIRSLGRRTYNPFDTSPFDGSVPSPPPLVPSQGPLSLNEAYLEYRRRLNVRQSQASATDNGAPGSSAALSGASPSIPQAPQSGFATIGQSNSAPPVRFLGPRNSTPLGSGIGGWTSSVDPTAPQYAAQPASSPQEPGGLLGMLLDYLRNNPDN